MSFTPPRNPFLDPDINQPLPPTPPTPPIPPRSALRPSQPLYAGATPTTSNNPYLKSSNVADGPSHRPDTTTDNKGWSNNPYHAVMSGANSEVDKKPVESVSGHNDQSSWQSKGNTLVSKTPPFAPSYPIGFDVNKPSTEIYTNNPFADPQPQTYKPRTTPTQRENELRGRVVHRPETAVRDFATFPTPKLVPSIRTDEQLLEECIQRARAKAALSYPGTKSTPSGKARPKTKYDIDREIKSRETARRQIYLLELEREKTAANLYPEVPRLRPSPRTTNPIRINPAGGIAREISSNSVEGLIQNTPNANNVQKETARKRMMKSPWFWFFFALIQCGIISTGAACAVLLRNKGVGKDINVSPGVTFWLICSVFGIVVGIIGSLCILGRRSQACAEFLQNTGLDEFGLMPNYGRREPIACPVVKDRAEADRLVLEKLARVREREQERMRGLGKRVDSMSSIRTVNPMWEALYFTPEQLKAKFSRDARFEAYEEKGKQLEGQNGNRMKWKKGKGVDAMMSGGSELQTFNESDIGTQVLKPDPANPFLSPEDTVNEDGFTKQPTYGNFTPQSKKSAESNLPNSIFDTPSAARERHYNDRQRGSTPNRLVIPDSSPYNQASASSNKYKPKPSSPLSSIISTDTPRAPPSPYINTYASSRTPNPDPNAISHLDLNQSVAIPASSQSLNKNSTPLQTCSPLENLAREFNTTELHNLPSHDRQSYLIERREEEQQRGKKVRASLDRGSSYGSGLGEDSGIASSTNGFGREKKPTIMKGKVEVSASSVVARQLKALVQQRVQDFEKKAEGNSVYSGSSDSLPLDCKIVRRLSGSGSGNLRGEVKAGNGGSVGGASV